MTAHEKRAKKAARHLENEREYLNYLRERYVRLRRDPIMNRYKEMYFRPTEENLYYAELNDIMEEMKEVKVRIAKNERIVR